MKRRQQRPRQRAAALVSMIVILIVVAAFAAVFLSVHTAQLATEERAIHRLRAQAATLAATHLTLWKLGNDSDLREAMGRVLCEGDTSFQADPLFEVSGDLAGAAFTVDVWPGPDTVRLKSTGISGGVYYERWAHMPISLGPNLGNRDIESYDLSGIAGEQIATQAVLCEDGTVASISAYVKGPPSKKLRYAIYSDSGGEPGALIVETVVETVGSSAFHWHTIDITPTPLTSGTYWLALAFNHATICVKQSGPGEGQLRHKTYDAVGNGFTPSWGASDASDTARLSIYASYTAD